MDTQFWYARRGKDFVRFSEMAERDMWVKATFNREALCSNGPEVTAFLALNPTWEQTAGVSWASLPAMKPSRVLVSAQPTGGFMVKPIWADVDRAFSFQMSVKREKDAQRLREAMLSGKAFKNAHVETDVDGNTYVEATCLIMGKHLNADLKKLGF